MLKRLFYDIHLYAGIASSVILFVICLTGTILVYEEELIACFDQQYSHSKNHEGTSLSLDQKLEKLEAETNGRVVGLMYFPETNANQIYSLAELVADHEPDEPKRPKSVIVNTHTGEIVEKPKTGTAASFFHWVTDLHRWLLLDRSIGRPITGAATLIFLLLSITGIVLYVPGKIKALFKRKFWFPPLYKKKGKTGALLLHRTYSWYSLAFLLVMALSALIWSYKWYYNGLEKLLGDKLGKQRFDKTITLPEAMQSSAVRLPLESILEQVDQALPYPGKAYRIDLPADSSQSIMVRKKSAAWYAYDAADKVQLNPQTGEVLEVDEFKNWSFGSKVAALIRTLHIGSVFGLASKFFYFLAALIATSLPVTGMIIWIKQLQSKSRLKKASFNIE